MEQQLFHLINQQWIGDVADRVMASASSLDVWIVPLVIILGLILLRGGFKGRAFVVVLALTIGVTDGIVSKSIKSAVGRMRPSQYEGTRIVKLEKVRPKVLAATAVFKETQVKIAKPKKKETRGASFPSSHTANNFAAAAVLMLFFRRGWLYLPMACLVSYSRMYTGSHWPGDVLFGTVLGLALGWGVTMGCEALWRRIGPRFTPGLYQRHPSLIGSKGVHSAPLAS